MIPKPQYAVLIALLQAYNQMTLDNLQNCQYEPEAMSLFNNIKKWTFKQRFSFSRIENTLADAYFEKIKNLDAELFEDKKFSPPILVLHLLMYLRDEIGDLSIRVRFGNYNLCKFLHEIETSKIRKEAMHHSFVIEKFLDCWGEVLKDEKSKLEEKRSHILKDKMAS